MNDELVNVLYGGQTTLRHCCGYCRAKGKYLTVKQMQKKQCLGKQCGALCKLDHNFWKVRDKKLQQKKEHKNEIKRNTLRYGL